MGDGRKKCWLNVHRNLIQFVLDGGQRGGVGVGVGYLCEARPKHSNLLLKCCFTSTETVGLLGTGAQDGHLDFHTAPEL